MRWPANAAAHACQQSIECVELGVELLLEAWPGGGAADHGISNGKARSPHVEGAGFRGVLASSEGNCGGVVFGLIGAIAAGSKV